MWDEKKFFEDYVNESEKIKPDDRFVEQLKHMAAQEEKKKKTIPMIKYVAVAASFVLCIGLGGIVWQRQNDAPEEKSAEYNMELQAGHQVAEDARMTSEDKLESDIQSESDVQSEGDIPEAEEETLTEALDCIRQGATIRDEDGNEVSQEQQEELYQLLKDAKEAEAPEEGEKENTYFLEGGQTIEIEVWENGFLKIGGKWYR